MLPLSVFTTDRAYPNTSGYKSHSAIFCVCVCEIKDTDNVLPAKENTTHTARENNCSFEFGPLRFAHK